MRYNKSTTTKTTRKKNGKKNPKQRKNRKSQRIIGWNFMWIYRILCLYYFHCVSLVVESPSKENWWNIKMRSKTHTRGTNDSLTRIIQTCDLFIQRIDVIKVLGIDINFLLLFATQTFDRIEIAFTGDTTETNPVTRTVKSTKKTYTKQTNIFNILFSERLSFRWFHPIYCLAFAIIYRPFVPIVSID